MATASSPPKIRPVQVSSRDVVAHQAAHQHHAGHVGHQAPLDLQHRHLHVGGHVAKVGPQGELEAAAERHAVHRGDYRHGDLAPDHAGVLRPVGAALGPLAGQERVRRLVPTAPSLAGRHRLEAAHVEAGAKGAPLAREHHRAQARLRLQPLAGLDQGREHGVVERIHLVGSDQAHVGDAALDINRHAIVHGNLPQAALST
jgi:hypothetical protein